MGIDGNTYIPMCIHADDAAAAMLGLQLHIPPPAHDGMCPNNGTCHGMPPSCTGEQVSIGSHVWHVLLVPGHQCCLPNAARSSLGEAGSWGGISASDRKTLKQQYECVNNMPMHEETTSVLQLFVCVCLMVMCTWAIYVVVLFPFASSLFCAPGVQAWEEQRKAPRRSRVQR